MISQYSYLLEMLISSEFWSHDSALPMGDGEKTQTI